MWSDYEAIAEVPYGKARELARLSLIAKVPQFVLITDGDDGDQQQVMDALSRYFRSDALLAVRSSADVEDSTGGSYAGMFETRLGVRLRDVAGAVNSVFASAAAARVADYQAARSTAASEVRMAVIVQEMVSSDVSGVALSSRAGNDTEMVVEAVYGLGEGLVSGRYAPDQYVIDRDNGRVTSSRVSFQRRALRLHRDGGVIEYNVSGPERQAPKLSASDVAAVVALVFEIERSLGLRHADVEWAIADRRIYCLQARPLVA